jgi:osmoprotectant transport system substrate-binding protein
MTRLVRAVSALVLGLLLAACAAGGGNIAGTEAPAPPQGEAAGGPVAVGSANFAESVILGNLYALALENAGLQVERRFNLGSREVYFQALTNGEIDMFPEYLGATHGHLTAGGGQGGGQEQVLTEVGQLRMAVTDALPEGLVLLESSQAQDQDALAVTEATASQYQLETVSDLAPVAGQLVAGGPAEEETRRVGLPGLREVYGIEFADFVVTDAGGPVTVEALRSNRIQVGRMFTTSGFIEAENFVVLHEDRPLIPAENITPIVREEVVTPRLEAALNAVSAALTTEKLTALNKRVEIDQEDPETVARDFLQAEGLLGG